MTRIGIVEWAIFAVVWLLPAVIAWYLVHFGKQRVPGGAWWVVACLLTGWLGFLLFLIVRRDAQASGQP